MCTVLFIPNKTENYFVSLRDENPMRARASAPSIHENNFIKYLSPIDPVASGTWIGINDFSNVIILLNGGFENHKSQKKYRKSRGLIVKELMTTELPVIEWSLMDLDNIEPFTLIVFSDNNLFQLVWDGSAKHKFKLDVNKPYMWSSATLYNKIAKDKRAELFENWIAMNPPTSKLSILNFFKLFDDAENGFLMNRNEKMKTLSYSFIELAKDNCKFNYYDFSNYTHHISTMELNNKFSYCSLIN